MTTQTTNLASVDSIDYNGANVETAIMDGTTIWAKIDGVAYYIGQTIWVNGVEKTITSLSGGLIFFEGGGSTGSVDPTDGSVSETDPGGGTDTGGGTDPGDGTDTGGGGTGGPSADDIDGDGIPNSSDTDNANNHIYSKLREGYSSVNAFANISPQVDSQELTDGILPNTDSFAFMGGHDSSIYASDGIIRGVNAYSDTTENVRKNEVRIKLRNPLLGSNNYSSNWVMVHIIDSIDNVGIKTTLKINASADHHNVWRGHAWHSDQLSAIDAQNDVGISGASYLGNSGNPGPCATYTGGLGSNFAGRCFFVNLSTGTGTDELRIKFEGANSYSAVQHMGAIAHVSVKFLGSQLTGMENVPSMTVYRSSTDTHKSDYYDVVHNYGIFNGIGSNVGHTMTMGDSLQPYKLGSSTPGNKLTIGKIYYVSPAGDNKWYLAQLYMMTNWVRTNDQPTFSTQARFEAIKTYSGMPNTGFIDVNGANERTDRIGPLDASGYPTMPSGGVEGT